MSDNLRFVRRAREGAPSASARSARSIPGQSAYEYRKSAPDRTNPRPWRDPSGATRREGGSVRTSAVTGSRGPCWRSARTHLFHAQHRAARCRPTPPKKRRWNATRPRSARRRRWRPRVQPPQKKMERNEGRRLRVALESWCDPAASAAEELGRADRQVSGAHLTQPRSAISGCDPSRRGHELPCRAAHGGRTSARAGPHPR